MHIFVSWMKVRKWKEPFIPQLFTKNTFVVSISEKMYSYISSVRFLLVICDIDSFFLLKSLKRSFCWKKILRICVRTLVSVRCYSPMVYLHKLACRKHLCRELSSIVSKMYYVSLYLCYEGNDNQNILFFLFSFPNAYAFDKLLGYEACYLVQMHFPVFLKQIFHPLIFINNLSADVSKIK